MEESFVSPVSQGSSMFISFGKVWVDASFLFSYKVSKKKKKAKGILNFQS